MMKAGAVTSGFALAAKNPDGAYANCRFYRATGIAMQSPVVATDRMSVRPSVRLSVRQRWHCVKTTQAGIRKYSSTLLVLATKSSFKNSRGFTAKMLERTVLTVE